MLLLSHPIAINEIVTPNWEAIKEDLNRFWIFKIENAPFFFSSINLKTLLGLINKKESSLAAKKAGKNKRNKSRVIFIQWQMNNGGGEDRTRLSQIMSLVHSPDCYTPKEIYVILITLNFNIQYKNNISKKTLLVSFCEISFFSSNL